MRIVTPLIHSHSLWSILCTKFTDVATRQPPPPFPSPCKVFNTLTCSGNSDLQLINTLLSECNLFFYLKDKGTISASISPSFPQTLWARAGDDGKPYRRISTCNRPVLTCTGAVPTCKDPYRPLPTCKRPLLTLTDLYSRSTDLYRSVPTCTDPYWPVKTCTVAVPTHTDPYRPGKNP